MSKVALSRRAARECAIKFLYQEERERTFYFQNQAFQEFCEHFDIAGEEADFARVLLEGCFRHLDKIDSTIAKAANNWTVERMGSTDRCVLRLAVFELAALDTPPKVVINEAIDLAKLYGTENSGRFVNGVLDRALKLLPITL